MSSSNQTLKSLELVEKLADVAPSPAVQEAEEKLRTDAHNPALWMEKGIALRRQMLFREAIEAYSLGLTADPFFALLYRHRGHAYVNIRMYAAGAADFETCLRLDPTNWDAWYHLALAYHLLGDYPRAKAAYESCYAISNDADSKIATTDWYCMTLMKMGDLEGMKKAAARITPDMPATEESDGYFKRCLVYGGHLKADDVLHEAEALDDHMYATTTYGLAVYYEQVLGDKDMAHTILKKITVRDATWGGFAEHAAHERLKTW